MSLLRNTDDNTINFQKASFTLDGCVKIWTSRVDSVGTETGKLLSNLAQDNGRDQEDDEDGEEGGADGDGEDARRKKQKVCVMLGVRIRQILSLVNRSIAQKILWSSNTPSFSSRSLILTLP